MIAVQVALSILDSFSCDKSIVIPPLRTASPHQVCPPPCTAILRPFSREKLTASNTSLSSLTVTMTSGDLSGFIAFHTSAVLVDSKIGSPWVTTVPRIRLRSTSQCPFFLALNIGLLFPIYPTFIHREDLAIVGCHSTPHQSHLFDHLIAVSPLA